MSPKDQRIEIAKACGWQESGQGTFILGTKEEDCEVAWNLDWLPDYLNDLNAMHEAEKTLNSDELVTYTSELIKLLDKDYSDGSAPYVSYFCAPAHQRAEAFLKAIGRWEEDENPLMKQMADSVESLVRK